MFKPKKIRLQKWLRDAGLASRRKSEELITAGAVRVNGKIITKMGTSIDPEEDRVAVDGKIIKAPTEEIYLVLNKPAGFTTTRADRFAARSVYELLPRELEKRVHPVGRLDRDTEGLLIFTSDGVLTYRLTHPKFEQEKEYLAVIDGTIDAQQREKINRGVKTDVGVLRGKVVSVVKKSGKPERSEIRLIITEGTKRQIRKIFAGLGFGEIYLERVREGKLKLGKLKRGEWRYIRKDDVI